jgi:nucleotide-binding universal stress UspA family protein
MNRLPLRHILCPIDLSSVSMNALDWANAIARARRAELRAFHVVVTTALTPSEGLGSAERDAILTKLRQALAAIDAANPQVGAAVRQGDPGTQTLAYARTVPADLIVMGAAGSERPARPIGSVTATVVARSNCPVLIVPTSRPVDRSKAGVFERIVCAVDLAPTSISVLRQAVSLAWETQAKLTCVCVMTEPTPAPSDIRSQLLGAIPRDAQEWCDIEFVVMQGAPATEIVRAVQTSDAEIVVIGPPRQWESTTQAVLAAALCPVMVMHDARPLPWPAA